MNSEIVFGLESASWPTLLVDAKGAVLRVNVAATSVFGAAVSGSSPHLSAIWPGENGESSEDFLKRWDQAQKPMVNLKFREASGATANYSVSICGVTKDDQRWYVLQLLPPVVAATPAVEDPSSQAVKQRLECALQIARTVSLDFNNALTGILGHSSFLLGKAEAGHPWRQSLMEVEKSAARAAEIASELQNFSRQEKEVPKAPFGNLNAVVTRCVEFFRNASGDQIVWNVQLEKKLLAARFDEAKLQQALTKILENAVEAVAGTRGQITAQTRNLNLTAPTQDRNVRLNAGVHVCVEINDNGKGIEPEILPRVFEPFFTTKRPPHRGLGLPLVYGIVTNHGGGVVLTGQPGAGASARIYLPAVHQLIDDGAGANRDLYGKECILVVDDESILLTVAETILTGFGYKVLTAINAEKALAILMRNDVKVDLVITDLVMPGMGGRELVERIRQMTPDKKIMCTSGYIVPTDGQLGTAFLQKPFTSRDLLEKVKLVVGA